MCCPILLRSAALLKYDTGCIQALAFIGVTTRLPGFSRIRTLGGLYFLLKCAESESCRSHQSSSKPPHGPSGSQPTDTQCVLGFSVKWVKIAVPSSNYSSLIFVFPINLACSVLDDKLCGSSAFFLDDPISFFLWLVIFCFLSLYCIFLHSSVHGHFQLRSRVLCFLPAQTVLQWAFLGCIPIFCIPLFIVCIPAGRGVFDIFCD